MAGERWNPWATLRARDHVMLEWTFLRGARGLCELHPDGATTIHLDPRLGRRERRCVLAHELVHDERRIGYTSSTPSALIELEERVVGREAVRRLVPPDELAELVEACGALEVWELADEFDVDQATARASWELARLGGRGARGVVW